MKKQKLIEGYNQRKDLLLELKNKLVSELEENLETIKFVSEIHGRVKSKKSFIKKALSAEQKYTHPFRDIEDIIGIRILVLFPDISSEVSEKVSKSVFPSIENEYRKEKKANQFGYEGYQSIHLIPESYTNIHQMNDLPHVFELQIRTLLQHAWEEPEHEINYKREKKFTDVAEFEYEKSFAWIAASCWGADKILNNLYQTYMKENNKKPT
ncbi:MAG: RelA/SpoT domain-containing protein [Spirochaetia bacterium]|jgi:putative GTP pyrophosphokinase|nr:RelA/SpoT domain-containing protein [Spirochaetia bacterium]